LRSPVEMLGEALNPVHPVARVDAGSQAPTTASPFGPDYRGPMTLPLRLVEFPADDPARARGFWTGLLDVQLESRAESEGEGWQTHGGGSALGLHPRGSGPGDRVSLPYFSVPRMDVALQRVRELGGEVIHPGSAGVSAGTPREAPSGSRSDRRRSLSRRSDQILGARVVLTAWVEHSPGPWRRSPAPSPWAPRSFPWSCCSTPLAQKGNGPRNCWSEPAEPSPWRRCG